MSTDAVVRLSAFQLGTLSQYVDRLTESRRNADQWTVAADTLIVVFGAGEYERLVRLVWDHSVRAYEVEVPTPPPSNAYDAEDFVRLINEARPPLRAVGAP